MNTFSITTAHLRVTGMCAIFQLLAAGGASAAVVSYSTQSAFTAATNSVVTDTFSAPAGGTTSIPTSLTLSGATFTNTQSGAGGLNEVSQTYCCATYARGADTLVSAGTPGVPDGINVALPGGTTAFAVTLFTVELADTAGGTTDKVDITLGGQTFTVTSLSAPGLVFIGFTSTTALTNVTIVPEVTGVYADLTSVEFGNKNAAGATPEPATFWTMGAGVLGALYLRRPRKSKVA